MMISNIGFIHIVWENNAERLKSDPPFGCVPGNIDTGDPDLDKLKVDSEKLQAKRYDYYRDIRSISLLQRVNGSPDSPRTVRHYRSRTGGSRKLDEFSMLRDFWAGTQETGISWLAGWNILNSTFPLLIGKSMQYGVPVPAQYMPNPFKKFQDVSVCDVSSIYTQGVFFKARPLPDLNNIASWWGLPSDDALPPVSAVQIASLSEEDMEAYGWRVIEKSLKALSDMLALYYDLRQV